MVVGIALIFLASLISPGFRMASQLPHRVFGVLFLLLSLALAGNNGVWDIAAGILVGVLFSASFLSPDIDLRVFGKRGHRSFAFHSLIIPLGAYAVFPHRIVFFVVLAWGSHILLDLFTAKNIPRFSPKPKNWGNRVNFSFALASALLALAFAVGALPPDFPQKLFLNN